jgi:hypothetical protein
MNSICVCHPIKGERKIFLMGHKRFKYEQTPGRLSAMNMNIDIIPFLRIIHII